MAGHSNKKVDSFDFTPGRFLARKYEVISNLGRGWEGEVYLVREHGTGIERTAKFFYPHRNPNNRTVRIYAKKLHKLRYCPIMIGYHAQDIIRVRGKEITFLVSEYVHGELLTDYLKRQPGKRLEAFQALHLLHALAEGLECIHRMREYHGDLHSDNIIVRRAGLGFDLKLLDIHNWMLPRKEIIREEVWDMIRLFYEVLGGSKRYSKLPGEIKTIVCGLRRSIIAKKFPSAGQLKRHLETMEWNTR